ncbi:COX assembly mitochondrial protein 2 homolog [Sipha flava]|uniref:COX assembly mitochondrial protein n=1 Tax=Sipha flava TaxID=143950 RepID=A0A8B8FBE5_9HEMI|nr:COX assembly mitochondrial protein 2 homolog [Sipha flava]
MHPDLSPHLHTNECNTFTFEYKDCTEKHRFLKFLGRCDDAYNRMVHCFHLERLAKRQKNYEKSMKHQELVRQKILIEMREEKKQELEM